MVSHRGIVNYFSFYVKAYELTTSDVVLQLASYSFDPSVREIIGPLTVGAEVVIVNNTDARDPVILLSKIRQHRVTCLLCVVPTMLNSLAEAALKENLSSHSIRIILAGGESLPSSVYNKSVSILGHHVIIVNQYGPTECSMVSTYYPILSPQPEGRIVLIGKPIHNSRVYVLDRNLNPVPAGATGQIHVSGPGVARGYLKQPDLTAEKLIPDPYCIEPGARMYRTGDLGRYLPDGTIEFLGRSDYQVKIRGFRIELGEIESKLIQHPAVSEAVVLAGNFGTDEKRLVGYVTGDRKKVPGTAEIRSFLKEKLPEYMVPSAFMAIRDFPLTPNGKIDRSALPDPGSTRPKIKATFVPPGTTTEKMLADFFAQLLGIDPVGTHDNFFDLGGHSLLATRVISRVNDALNVQVPLRTFYESPTVASLALTVLQSKIKKENGRAVDRLLDELEKLSDEEAEALLEVEQVSEGDAVASLLKNHDD
jgi:acyl-coenzyme A synthetase/AMP-(fatty) acid ligase